MVQCGYGTRSVERCMLHAGTMKRQIKQKLFHVLQIQKCMTNNRRERLTCVRGNSACSNTSSTKLVWELRCCFQILFSPLYGLVRFFPRFSDMFVLLFLSSVICHVILNFLSLLSSCAFQTCVLSQCMLSVKEGKHLP